MKNSLLPSGVPLAALFFLIPARASAQSCSLVEDLNQIASAVSSLDSDSTSVLCNGVTYFTASTQASGVELWSTTGVPGSTQLVAEIAPGALGSDPEQLFCHGGMLYFSADDGTSGRELWRTDGTAAGTQLVLDIAPGSFSSRPKGFLSFGGKLYFAAYTTTIGEELWSSDGTAAGTQLVLDVIPGGASSVPRELVATASGAGFLFHAYGSGGVGDVLFVSDGSTAGTQPVFPAPAVQPFSAPQVLTRVGVEVFFSASTPATGFELWKTDGTPAGTQMIADINPGPPSAFFTGIPELIDLNGVAYFSATSPGVQEELWRSDGTALGTSLVADLNPGLWSSNPKELTVFGNDLVFVASTKSLGERLYVLDSALGTAQLMFPSSLVETSPKHLTVSGNLLYFSYRTNAAGAEPFVTDGLVLQQLADITPALFGSFPAMFSPLAGGGVVFSALEESIGRELFVSLGAPATTALLADIEPLVKTSSSSPRGLTSISGSTLYFRANNGLNFDGPFRWDAVNGAVQLAEIYNSDGFYTISSEARSFTQVWLGDKQRVIFDAESDFAGREPWITDGTPAGTQQLLDIAPNLQFSNSSDPKGYTAAFGKVFFSAFDGSDRELWVSNGEAAGTFELKDIATGPSLSSNPSDFVQLGGQLLFRATDAAGDTELWSTDGTSAGTQRLIDLGVGYSSAPRELTRVGSQVAFIVDRPAPWTGTELWKTDGTSAGTQLVSKLGVGVAAGPVEGLTVLDGVLFFVGKSGGKGLWRSDLTGAGTTLVKSFGSGFVFGELVAGTGKLFFGFAELYVSDGTAAGTLQLTSAPLGTGISRPQWITPAGGGVFFAPAYVDPLEDRELFFSDGTPAGTGVVCDLEAGSTSSDPTDLALVGGNLMFAANVASQAGDELWQAAPSGAYVADLGISGAGHMLSATQPLLGSTVVIRGENASTTQLSLLGLGTPLPGPTNQLVAPGSAAWIDPLAAFILHVSATPSWSFSLTIPASPALAGLLFTVQSWTPGSSTVFPATTSNGLLFVLGS